MALAAGDKLGPYEIMDPSARVAWERYTEQPIRLWILRGASPLAVNCLYSDGKYIRSMQR
jgi:hypothetical protein